MAESPADMFAKIPPITRGWLLASLMSTSACALGLISPMHLYFDWRLVFYNFQIWRLLTCFVFFGKFSMPFAFSMYMCYMYSNRYEQAPYSSTSKSVVGRTGDYAWMLIIGGVCLLFFGGYLLGEPFFGMPAVFMAMYVWSRKNANQPVSMFGFQFRGMHMPWVMLAFSILLGNSPVPNLLGIVAGHSYYFLLTVVPAKYGYNLIETPQFIHDFFEVGRFTTTQTTSGNTVRMARPQGQHYWGTGRALGGN
eukprot:g437.t1